MNVKIVYARSGRQRVVSERDASILVKLGRARRMTEAPLPAAESAPAPPPAEPPPAQPPVSAPHVPEVDPQAAEEASPHIEKPKRAYKRRDMVAE